MTLEALMKSKGYTEQEMTDLKPLLSNAKFRADLEAELSNGEKALTDLDAYDKWFTNEITPEHAKLLRERDEAKAEAAAEKARTEALKRAAAARAGGKTEAQIAAEEAEVARKAAEERDRQERIDPRYVPADVFTKAFESTGDAIADAQDLVSDFMQLYPGQRLNLKQMRTEAKAAKQSVRQYVESKFNFTAKRDELDKAARQKEISDAVSKREQELMVQYGGSNPNLQTLRPSSNPFVERKKADAGKQPWEKNENEISRGRIERAVQAAAKRGDLIPS
jgi:hypothetical protein